MGVRKDSQEDGWPLSTGSAAAPAVSSLANPDGQHWPLRNLRPHQADNSIGEMAVRSEYQPQTLPYQEGFQTLKTSRQRHAQLNGRPWRRHAFRPGQGATYLGRDKPLDQLPDKGGQA